jgi:hypothetical protein
MPKLLKNLPLGGATEIGSSPHVVSVRLMALAKRCGANTSM